MIRLAEEANARTRLVRIVWLSAGDERRCVAQVDLTGLPTPFDRTAALHAVWRGMIEMALAGLELTLRRLGRELAILDSGKYGALTQEVADEEPRATLARETGEEPCESAAGTGPAAEPCVWSERR